MLIFQKRQSDDQTKQSMLTAPFLWNIIWNHFIHALPTKANNDATTDGGSSEETAMVAGVMTMIPNPSAEWHHSWCQPMTNGRRNSKDVMNTRQKIQKNSMRVAHVSFNPVWQSDASSPCSVLRPINGARCTWWDKFHDWMDLDVISHVLSIRLAALAPIPDTVTCCGRYCLPPFSSIGTACRSRTTPFKAAPNGQCKANL